MPSVRGDLYRLKAPKDIRGHEQAGSRYAVVVQSDDLPLSTWIIALTSTGRQAASFRPEIQVDGTKTRVLVEQLTVVDPQTRLGEFTAAWTASKCKPLMPHSKPFSHWTERSLRRPRCPPSARQGRTRFATLPSRSSGLLDSDHKV